jgi:hypothetical protein
VSASDKLAALKPFTITVKPTAYAGPETTYDLYDIPLPQIVAVVKAAEGTDGAWFGAWKRHALRDRHAKARAALAALEEVLL